ncbi:tyrosine-protein phosphatase non-receptor type 5-like [Tachypleus tridentatus]|uniref:tyrosine-protein phosphatase non-receptor type 5-like n=1 Tax=Tachypleus tridentatus TaxID=6853 RepID=UPI003FD4BB4B
MIVICILFDQWKSVFSLVFLSNYLCWYSNSNQTTVLWCVRERGNSGTGRTGIVLALDICMREFEECRTVDILRCVSRLRQDRGGAVQTKEQYFFLYEAQHGQVG